MPWSSSHSITALKLIPAKTEPSFVGWHIPDESETPDQAVIEWEDDHGTRYELLTRTNDGLFPDTDRFKLHGPLNQITVATNVIDEAAALRPLPDMLIIQTDGTCSAEVKDSDGTYTVSWEGAATTNGEPAAFNIKYLKEAAKTHTLN